MVSSFFMFVPLKQLLLLFIVQSISFIHYICKICSEGFVNSAKFPINVINYYSALSNYQQTADSVTMQILG